MVALWHTRLHFRCQVLRTGFSYEQHPPCTLLPCCLFLIYGYSTGSTTAQNHQQSISQQISSMKRTNLANITFSVHLHYKVTYTLHAIPCGCLHETIGPSCLCNDLQLCCMWCLAAALALFRISFWTSPLPQAASTLIGWSSLHSSTIHPWHDQIFSLLDIFRASARCWIHIFQPFTHSNRAVLQVPTDHRLTRSFCQRSAQIVREWKIKATIL